MKKDNKIIITNEYDKKQKEYFQDFGYDILVKKNKELNHFNEYAKTNCNLDKTKNN